MPISSVSSGGPNLHRHFRVKTVSETVDKFRIFLLVLTDVYYTLATIRMVPVLCTHGDPY
eukprot:COSAG02_NODE_4355_length_5460_cov_2.632904_2_plen_60_part_00